MADTRKRRTVRLPPGTYQQLWATARMAEVPIDEVVRIALIHFSRLDHGTKVGIVGEFWYRGQDVREPTGQRQRLRPVFTDEGSMGGMVRAGIARVCRYLARSQRSEERRHAA